MLMDLFIKEEEDEGGQLMLLGWQRPNRKREWKESPPKRNVVVVRRVRVNFSFLGLGNCQVTTAATDLSVKERERKVK